MPDDARPQGVTEASAKKARILEIDLIRGFMLISMAIDHGTSLTRIMGRTGGSVMTIAQVLPSTTAEIFFLMSGYLYGHVRLARVEAVDWGIVTDPWHRAWQIYASNAVTLLVVAALMSVAPPVLIEAGRFSAHLEDPFGGIRDFILMRTAPVGLDVLQLYVVLFLATPLFAAILLRRPNIALSWLAACWISVQIWGATIGFEHDETIAINLWAWQITFFGGMALGVMRRYEVIAETIDRHSAIVWTAALILLIMAVAWMGQKYPHRLGLDGPPWTMPGVDRATLGPLKVLSSLCVLVILMWGCRRYALATKSFGCSVALLGRRSLACFCASNVALYGMGLLWAATGTATAYLVGEILLVGLVFAWVAFVNLIEPDAKPLTALAKPARRETAVSRPNSEARRPYTGPAKDSAVGRLFARNRHR